MMNICDKFRWNPSNKYGHITSHKMSVNGQRRDGLTMETWLDNTKHARQCRHKPE